MGKSKPMRPMHQLRALQAQYKKLRQQAAQLEQQHASLARESSVLQTVCEGLAALPLLPPEQAQDAASSQQQQQEALTDLLEEEDRLLQQLPCVPPAASEHQQALLRAASTVSGVPTIAPAEDPMALLRDMVARPMLSPSSMDLTLQYSATVRECALQLHLADGPSLDLSQDQAAALAQIKASMESLMHMLTSCLRAGRYHVVQEYSSRNAATLQVKQRVQHECLARVAAAVAKVGLTPEQEQAIGMAVPVWLRMLGPVSQEFSQLLQQQIAQDPSNSSNSSSTTTTTTSTTSGAAATSATHSNSSNSSMLLSSARNGPNGGGGCGRGSGGAAQLHLPPAGDFTRLRQEQLQAARQRVERFRKVMNKTALVNLVFAVWVGGRVTWPQLARLTVLTWPYPLNAADLAQFIEQRWRARVAQQQQ